MKTPVNPKLGTSYKITNLSSSNVSRAWKSRKDWGIVPGWCILDRHNNSMQCMILNWVLLLQNILLRQLTKLEWDLWIRWWSRINVNFLILMVALWLGRRSLFVENNTKNIWGDGAPSPHSQMVENKKFFALHLTFFFNFANVSR